MGHILNNATGFGMKIYGLMKCAPDLSSFDCNSCFRLCLEKLEDVAKVILMLRYFFRLVFYGIRMFLFIMILR